MTAASGSGALVPASPPLQAFVRRLEAVLDTASDDEIGRRAIEACALEALADILAAPDLLSAAQCQGAEASYCRHLLHADPRGRFTALALVWRPGQASPVHGHTAWCAVGVVSGVALEERFDLVERGSASEVHAVHLAGRDARHRPGAVLLTRPGADGVHRIRNADSDDLVTIHVYGRDLSEDPTLINVVYEE